MRKEFFHGKPSTPCHGAERRRARALFFFFSFVFRPAKDARLCRLPAAAAAALPSSSLSPRGAAPPVKISMPSLNVPAITHTWLACRCLRSQQQARDAMPPDAQHAMPTIPRRAYQATLSALFLLRVFDFVSRHSRHEKFVVFHSFFVFFSVVLPFVSRSALPPLRRAGFQFFSARYYADCIFHGASARFRSAAAAHLLFFFATFPSSLYAADALVA